MSADYSDATRTEAHDDAIEADQAAIRGEAINWAILPPTFAPSRGEDVPWPRAARALRSKLTAIRTLHRPTIVLMGSADPTCQTCAGIDKHGRLAHLAWPCATLRAAS